MNEGENEEEIIYECSLGLHLNKKSDDDIYSPLMPSFTHLLKTNDVLKNPGTYIFKLIVSKI